MKETNIIIRVSQEQKELLKAHCAAVGITISDFLRDYITRELALKGGTANGK